MRRILPLVCVVTLGAPALAVPPPDPSCGQPPAELEAPAFPLGAPSTGPLDVTSPRLGGGSAFFRLAGTPPGPRTGRDSPVELRLSGPSRRRVGQPLLLRLSFASRSRGPVVLLRPLDGSFEHMRAPSYDLHLRDEGDGRVYRWGFVGGRCGNVNAIRREDYVTLAPGTRRDDVVNGWASHLVRASIPIAGRWVVWVVHRFCGFDVRGLPLGPDVVRASTHRGVHASDGVSITVR